METEEVKVEGSQSNGL